jgi:hypothetical protein
MIQPGNGLPFMPLSGYQDMSKDVYSWLSKSKIQQFQQQQQEYEQQLKPEDLPPKFNYNIDFKANNYEGSYHSNYKASDV